MSEVPVEVWRLSRTSDSKYLLILRDHSRQTLPMVIGPCEAMAIWRAIHPHRSPKSAMIHDLLRELVERLGGRLVRVVIDDLWNGIYYAKLHIAADGAAVTVDDRPSDAVAVALRMNAPLFASEQVLLAAEDPESAPDSGESDAGGDLDLDDL
jgi:hypothetical protein